MQRIRKHLPSPALVVAIVALVAALGGTSLAAGLGILNTKAKNKTVGVGPLTYITGPVVSGPGDNVATATCPGGLRAIGGGVSQTSGSPVVRDSHMTPSGWSALVNLSVAADRAQAVVACARSRVVTGTPPG